MILNVPSNKIVNIGEAAFRALTANEDGSIPAYLLDLSGKFIYVSPSWLRHTGKTEDEVLGQQIHLMGLKFYGSDEFYKTMRDMIIDRGYFNFNQEIFGDQMASNQITPINSLEGEQLGYVGFIKNICDSVSEDSGNTQVFESLGLYIYSFDILDGFLKKTRHSPACEKVTGYSTNDFEKDPNLWHKMVYPDDLIHLFEFNKKLMAGEEVDYVEHRIITKDKRVRWIRNSPVVTKDNTGKTINVTGVIQNVTEQKLAHEILVKHKNIKPYAGLRLENRLSLQDKKIVSLEKKLEGVLAKKTKTYDEFVVEQAIKPPIFNYKKRPAIFDIDFSDNIFAGKGYILDDPGSDRGQDILSKHLKNGLNGLIIGRVKPEKFSEIYGTETNVIWLGTEKSIENFIPPTRLMSLKNAIIDFMDNSMDSMILISRPELLIIENGFNKFLNFLTSMMDYAIKSNARVLVSMDYLTISDRELRVLKEELEELDSDNKNTLPRKHYLMLEHIRIQNNRGIKPTKTQLAEALDISRNTVTKYLEDLTRQGLVKLTTMGNSQPIEVTEKGRKTIG